MDLAFSLAYKPGTILENMVLRILKQRKGFVDEPIHVFPGLLEANDSGIGSLLVFSIGADLFSEDGLIAFDVKNVVNNLESKAYFLAIGCQGLEDVLGGFSEDGANPDSTSNQGPGFALMDPRNFFGGNNFPLRLDIRYLAAEHACSTDGVGQFKNSAVGAGFGDKLESENVKGISRQDSNRLPEFLVAGRHAAPEVIVIHTRQIIVNK
jgi:hypothetical protein